MVKFLIIATDRLVNDGYQTLVAIESTSGEKLGECGAGIQEAVRGDRRNCDQLMKELRADIEIHASPERVWQLLTDFSSFPDWNPFIRKIIGEAKAGSRLEVRIEPSGARGMTFRPRVLKAEPNRELRWLGRLLIPGLFDGEHIFTIEPLNVNRVRFVQREKFSGLLVPLFARSLDRDTKRGFNEMNQALKVRAETDS